MLSSSLVQSGANAQASNPAANPLAPAPAAAEVTTPATSTASLDGTTATGELQGDLFAGQLTDVLVSAELPEVAGEPAPEQQTQDQAEPNAEEWLLAMLSQQQVQLQARDIPAPVTPVMAATQAPMPAAATTTLNTSDTRQPSVAVTQATASAADKFAPAPAAQVIAMDAAQEKAPVNRPQATAAGLPQDKPVTGTTAAPQANPAPGTYAMQAAAQHSGADNSRVDSARADTASILAINSSATATTLAQGTSAVADTLNSSLIHAASGTAPAAETAARTGIQSPLSLQTPEAKWGEQLLHTLRDNVQVQIQQRIQNATIRLDPPELGSLEIYVSHESGRLHVQITASQADVARLIQHTSDRLRQELSGPQFTQVNVQTSAEGQSGQQQSRERQRALADELILANDQPLVGSDQRTNRAGDVLVTV